jgi:hypothetical protein
LEVHHGFLVVAQASEATRLAGFLYVLWAEGATRCRWYLGLLAGLRDR